MEPATWTLVMILMFIGGSPASTAGGIKTTTLAVVVLAGAAAIRGREETVVGGRRLPFRTVMEAGAIASFGVACMLLGLVAIQLTQSMALEIALFEVVSALGTVGLSIGGTSQLDAVGKVIVMVMMFAGRVGPLTLFVMIAERRAERGPARPEGTIAVG
jgi:trk system potassium uptake protein TrkH